MSLIKAIENRRQVEEQARAAQRKEAMGRYLQLARGEAANDAMMTDDVCDAQVDELLSVLSTLGLPIDQFAADVQSLRDLARDERLALQFNDRQQRVTFLRSQGAAAASLIRSEAEAKESLAAWERMKTLKRQRPHLFQ